ncbi:MAG: hypothetical protein IPM47_09505 [Sphingobacteriales bacterium]|nr:MAG: hypothetical protein IPM47_09505 [Sphingobacteriales bacterium]
MQTPLSEQTSHLFRTLGLIFTALVVVQLVAFVVLFQTKQTNEEMNSVLQLIAGILAVGAILGAPFIYMNLLRSRITSKTPLEEKLRHYFTANIMKLAILEGAALFCLISLFITGKIVHAYLFMAVFFSFMLHRPTPSKCAADLQLTEEDKNQMVGK